MNVLHKTVSLSASVALAVAVFSLAGYSSLAIGQDAKVTLSGDQEVPAVATSATGSSTLAVSADHSVSGSVMTSGVVGTAAHVHAAAAGQNGPVVIPLTKSGDNMWSVPPGTKLTDAQYESFKTGGLYVNVHSAAHPGSEIRGQLKTMMGMTPTEQRGTGTSMTNPVGVDGKPITTFNQSTVDRPTGTSLTVPLGTDGKPLGQTTSFGQR
jgi:hypothetical protein